MFPSRVKVDTCVTWEGLVYVLALLYTFLSLVYVIIYYKFARIIIVQKYALLYHFLTTGYLIQILYSLSVLAGRQLYKFTLHIHTEKIFKLTTHCNRRKYLMLCPYVILICAICK